MLNICRHLVTNFRTRFSPSSLKSNIQKWNIGGCRNYYKPKQKDAFFDVEGVINKDTLLFRYEDAGSVRSQNIIALSMFPIWAYLGYDVFSLKKKMKHSEEKVESKDDQKLSFLFNNVMSASRGVGVGFFLFGLGMTSYWIIRTMHTVRKLYLKKGGKYVMIQTYGLLGRNESFFNVPVVHCSGIQYKFYGNHKFFLKVKDHSFKYSFNLEDGIISNKPLFDRILGISRTFAR
eukprot:TRINITY_DN5267_c2_g1_i1.p1 TRINITY_DN5267_c2_g1~~TRINITY_DN5267_c2_g1_i1.p1  ORF type:complete len:233 (-),score=16.32 TRINITY_DN5267_c2_g1_i1:219-917(-)